MNLLLKYTLGLIVLVFSSLTAANSSEELNSCTGYAPSTKFSRGHYNQWDLSLRGINYKPINNPENLVLDEDFNLSQPIKSNNANDFFRFLGQGVKTISLNQHYETESIIACLDSKLNTKTEFYLIRQQAFEKYIEPECDSIIKNLNKKLENILEDYRLNLALLQNIDPWTFMDKAWAKDVDLLFRDKLTYPKEIKSFSFFDSLEDLHRDEKLRAFDVLLKTLQPLSTHPLKTVNDIHNFIRKYRKHNHQTLTNKTQIKKALVKLIQQQTQLFKQNINDLHFVAYYTAKKSGNLKALRKAFLEIQANSITLLTTDLNLKNLSNYPISLMNKVLEPKENKKFCGAALNWLQHQKDQKYWSSIYWLAADATSCVLSAVTGLYPICLGVLSLHTANVLIKSGKQSMNAHQRAFASGFKSDLIGSFEDSKLKKKQFNLDLLLAPISFSSVGKISVGLAKTIPQATNNSFKNLILKKENVPELKDLTLKDTDNFGQKSLKWIQLTGRNANKYIFTPIACLLGTCRGVRKIVEKSLLIKPGETIRPFLSYPLLIVGGSTFIYPKYLDGYSALRFQAIIDDPSNPYSKYLQPFKDKLTNETIGALQKSFPYLYKVLENPAFKNIKQKLDNNEISIFDLSAELNGYNEEINKLANTPAFRSLYLKIEAKKLTFDEAISQKEEIEHNYKQLIEPLNTMDSHIAHWVQLVDSNQSPAQLVGFRFKYLNRKLVFSILNSQLGTHKFNAFINDAFDVSQETLSKINPQQKSEIENKIMDYIFLKWSYNRYVVPHLLKINKVAKTQEEKNQLMTSLIEEFGKLAKSYYRQGLNTHPLFEEHINNLIKIQTASEDHPAQFNKHLILKENILIKTSGNILDEYLFLDAKVYINHRLLKNNVTPFYIPYQLEGYVLPLKHISLYTIQTNISDTPSTQLITNGPPPTSEEIILELGKEFDSFDKILDYGRREFYLLKN